MPKCTKAYKNKEKLRLYRNRQRKNNYKKTYVEAKKRMWQDWEIILLSKKNNTGTDRELAKLLNRSVQAIQVKRSKIKKHEENT